MDNEEVLCGGFTGGEEGEGSLIDVARSSTTMETSKDIQAGFRNRVWAAKRQGTSNLRKEVFL